MRDEIGIVICPMQIAMSALHARSLGRIRIAHHNLKPRFPRRKRGSDCAIRRRANVEGAWTFNVRNFMVPLVKKNVRRSNAYRSSAARPDGMPR